jgi:hypothetical protein
MAWTPIKQASQLEGRHETATFDIKQTYDFGGGPSARQDVAKDIAAFANAVGGTIVVGAAEALEGGRKTGRIVAFTRLVNDTAAFISTVSKSVGDRCRPGPLFDFVPLTLDVNDQARILERPDSGNGVVSVFAINVWPALHGPIGVRASERDGSLIGSPLEAPYWFPKRTGEGTRFLFPEVLALQMNVHDRRIAILLTEIPEGAEVLVFDAKRELHPRPHRIKGTHYERSLLTLEEAEKPGLLAIVPFTFISEVWRDSRGDWNLFIRGRLLEGIANHGNFRPE